MTFEEKRACREACVRGVPFFCGGHTIEPIPFDELSMDDCCCQCEMDTECKDDIFEMCDFVNTFHGYDEFCFKFKEPNYKQTHRQRSTYRAEQSA